MNILGISALYHDSAAALVQDGDVVAAAQEERFSRLKHDPSFPTRSIAYCLRAGGVAADGLDAVVFYEKPLTKLVRILRTYAAVSPRGMRTFRDAVSVWTKSKLWVPYQIERELGSLGYRMPKDLFFTEHHQSHGASAFFPSPFESAAILTMDAVGESATASIARGSGNRMELLRQLHYPHSLGMLYSAFTYFCGFRVNSGEYKLMGLAPYGRPVYTETILEELVDLRPDGSLRLNLAYFDFIAGTTMTNRGFARLFGGPPRQPETEITRRDMDLAASIQAVTEEAVLRMARTAAVLTGERNLCLAGGVALNSVANGRLLRESPFERIWIQPAAGDAGGSLGAALFTWHQTMGNERRPPARDGMHGGYLGPQFGSGEIRGFLETEGHPFDAVTNPQEWAERIARLLAQGKVVGVLIGRMEFGPRALGHRSILADPRSPAMQTLLNTKVTASSRRSIVRPDARCWSTRRSTCAASRSCARPRTRIRRSCPPTSIGSCWRTACCPRSSKPRARSASGPGLIWCSTDARAGRLMRRLRHLLRLLWELVGFSVVNRMWWPVPLVLLLLLAGAVMLAAQVAAPFTVYTLF